MDWYFLNDPLFYFTALLGLCFGSFVTAVSYRLPRGNDFVVGRSFCPSCNRNLTALDLIPVLSWIINKGKCRYCGTKVSFRYPLIEITQMCSFILIYVIYGSSLQSMILQFLSVALLIMIVIDLEFKIIPDRLQIVMFLMGIFYWVTVSKIPFLDVIISIFVVLAMSLGLRALFSWWKKREALGLGDVKFFVTVCIFLGLEPIPFFFFLSGVIGLVFGLAWRKITKDIEFPFGPAIAISLFVNLLYPKLYIDFTLLLNFNGYISAS